MAVIQSLILGLTVLGLGTVYCQESFLLKICSSLPQSWVDKACRHLWYSGAKEDNKVLLGQIILTALIMIFASIALPSPFNYIPLLMTLLATTLYFQKTKQRQDQVKNELIHMSSTLSLAVAGGQDMSVAMTFYCSNEKGLLPEACRDSLSRLLLGQHLEVVFDTVHQRYPVTRDFFSAIRLSQRQGTPLAAVLKDQAQRLRDNRLLRMETRAQKLPVLLLGPLILCVFPNVFLVLLGPYLIDML